MANDSDPETPVSVSTGDVRVGKGFEAERFPVPAIAFEIESLADEPIRIRLVDRIPESFAMEGVGFHPDYDSDNWTAYRDHRVAYERTLDPGESVLTVYGIRIDDPEEATAFLDEPTVELLDIDTGDDDIDADTTGSEDVLGRETTQVVRDALSGNGAADLSAAGSEAASDADAESAPLLGDEGVTPQPTDDDLASAMGDRDESVHAVDTADEDGEAINESDEMIGEGDEMIGEGGETIDDDDQMIGEDDEMVDEDDEAMDEDDQVTEEPEAVGHADAAAALDPQAGDGTADDDAASDEMTEDGTGDTTEADASAPTADDDTATPTADDDTAAVTTDDDTDGGPTATPGSVASALAAEIRAGSVDDDDLAVLREAFEDEVPTSVDVRVSRLQSQVEDVLAYRDALADFLDENGTAEAVLGDVSEDLADLHDRVDDLDRSLSAAADDRAALREEVTETADAVADASERLDAVEGASERLDAVDDDLDRIESRLARLDEQLAAVEDVEADIEEIQSELDDLQSFRDRLNSAFGPGDG
ncbi:hypothetical protein ACOZ4L_02315 [Haloplanus ruber]|uniref:AAA family ATPase n=1 Tax=Haloplanus ruber TaxID=869892 RepID=A0ABD6CZG7_9EURY|nr:hypothetical protein [Haloplanus ruber]